MQIQAIARINLACYGVMCPHHETCVRYAMIETHPHHQRIASCSNGGDDWPLYIKEDVTIRNDSGSK